MKNLCIIILLIPILTFFVFGILREGVGEIEVVERRHAHAADFKQLKAACMERKRNQAAVCTIWADDMLKKMEDMPHD